MGMAVADEFNDIQDKIAAEQEVYHEYKYETEGNESWAGALPVKQLVAPPYSALGYMTD